MKCGIWALALSLAGLSPLFASAASVTATLYPSNAVPVSGVQPGTSTMTIAFNNSVGYGPVWVGQLNWYSATSTDWSSDLNPQLQSILGSGGTFSSFCIDGVQDVYFGQPATWANGVVALDTAPSPGPSMGLSKANLLTELFDRSYASIGTDNELGAAFQLAIYEIVYDGIPTLGGADASSFSAGNFQASGDSAAINAAVAMLNGITGSGYANNYTLYALTDDTIQDQLIAVPNVVPVPVPAALPSGLALLLGLYAFRKFRAKMRE